MTRVSRVGVAVLVLAASAAPASAQTRTWNDRVFVNANAGFRPTETTFQDNITFIGDGKEQGDFDAKYTTPAAPVFDISGGVRVWRNLGLGVGVSLYRKGSAANITGRIPHPFFFDRWREVTGDSGSLEREELAAHVQAMWMIAAGRKIDVAIFAGPSYIMVRQPLVDSLRVDEVYPYDTTSLAGANAATRKKNVLGYNVGGDVTYMLSKRVGVGGGVRFSRAQARLNTNDAGTLKVNLGGPQALSGVRLRF